MSTEWSDQVEGRDALAPALCEVAPCCTGWRGMMGCGCRGPPMFGRGWQRQRQTQCLKGSQEVKLLHKCKKYRKAATRFSNIGL